MLPLLKQIMVTKTSFSGLKKDYFLKAPKLCVCIYINKIIFNTKDLTFTDEVCPTNRVSLEALDSCAPFKVLVVTKKNALAINPFTP